MLQESAPDGNFWSHDAVGLTSRRNFWRPTAKERERLRRIRESNAHDLLDLLGGVKIFRSKTLFPGEVCASKTREMIQSIRACASRSILAVYLFAVMMTDPLVLELFNVLTSHKHYPLGQGVCALNLGEVKQVSRQAWTRVVNMLPQTKLQAIFLDDTSIPWDLKAGAIAAVRANRLTHKDLDIMSNEVLALTNRLSPPALSPNVPSPGRWTDDRQD